MSTTSSLRRLAIAGITGALLLGTGLASSPASAQQRDFANPLTTPATDDLDIKTLSVDANTEAVTLRMRVEHLSDTFAVQAILAPQRTVTGDSQQTYVIVEHATGALKLTGRRRAAGGQAANVPTEAMHATLDGGELDVTIDEAHVGWAGPYYAAAALLSGSTQVFAGVAKVTGPGGVLQSIDGFGPFSTDQDVTSTRLTVSRPSGSTPARLTATVTPAVPGTVTFYDGNRPIATTTSSTGTATAALPATLSPGTHLLRTVFAPTDALRYAASGASAPLKVVAATLRLSGGVQHRGRKPVRATLTIAGARSGSAVIYDGARKIKMARISHSTVRVALPRRLRVGVHRIKAVVTTTEGGTTTTASSNTTRLKVSAR